MPILYNTDAHPAIVDPGQPAVMPGEGFDFPDEEVEGRTAGQWSETDPRAGLPAEKAFKAKRDATPAAQKAAAEQPQPSPAPAGDTKETKE